MPPTMYLLVLYHITLLSSSLSAFISSQAKASNLCTIPHRLEAVSCQMIVFLGGGVFHSQPQPTFQRLQIAEQNVVNLIAYQRRMGFIRRAAAVQAFC